MGEKRSRGDDDADETPTKVAKGEEKTKWKELEEKRAKAWQAAAEANQAAAEANSRLADVEQECEAAGMN